MPILSLVKIAGSLVTAGFKAIFYYAYSYIYHHCYLCIVIEFNTMVTCYRLTLMAAMVIQGLRFVFIVREKIIIPMIVRYALGGEAEQSLIVFLWLSPL